MSVWRVNDDALQPLPDTRLDSEQRLEDWLWRDPSLLGMNLLLIGRQVVTNTGGRIDILAIDENANTVILELKRDRTPRDIVAQVLDYASWVCTLGYDELDQIAQKTHGRSLADAFTDHFGSSPPESVNTGHSMYLIASELDDSSERIINYLATQHGLAINALFFNAFRDGESELLGRAWLTDPTEIAERQASRKQVPWTGCWFVNVGEGPYRTWDDLVRYGYHSAGQGEWYSRSIQRLRVSDKVFAYFGGHGYVGYGEVTKDAVPIRDFLVESEGKKLLDLPLAAPNAADNAESDALCEWVVGVRWLRTLPKEHARTFPGAFANPNTACKLKDPATLEFLRREFGVERAVTV